MRIVIVEDEILIREGVMKLVRRLEPDCTFVGEASNGSDGLRILLAQRPDLVITDIRMPDMDGLTMLESMREQGCSCKAIVLTAHSEFEYAKQAVKLGVVEYLLKPIVVDDFMEALRRVKRMIVQEVSTPKHPESLRSLRVIYRAVLSGMPLDHEVEDFLQSAYGLRAQGAFTLTLLYPLRRLYDTDWSAVHALNQELCKRYEDSARLIELASERMAALIYSGDSAGFTCALEASLPPGAFVAGFLTCTGLGALQAAMRDIAAHMDVCLALDRDVLDVGMLPDEAEFRTLIYPIAIENQARTALWEKDMARLTKLCEQFLTTILQDGAPHRPREIKETCVRFFWALVSTAADSGNLQAERLERQALLERVMNAVSRADLRAAGAWLLSSLGGEEKEPDASESSMVSRARAQVREYYAAGVTLEEIAERLKVSPEYLSQQFHKETGVKFSAYIRSIRIEKAKELLRITDCKIYEVAQRVGYADAKYFAKVFKADTGMMPIEYRARG